ncbi:response regulator [Devosia nitrariae]|uniref:Response regulator n=1 Tax=Devosia nitrariae TaxID=2071872 RepID=A0ABQ5WAU6_9HYPH|nr:response regulator [Devosia nitrariae]GLQ56894.1 response regulator [Devosia nitrariae]
MPVETITAHGVLIADHSQHMIDIVAAMLRHAGRRDIRSATDAAGAMFELKRRDFEVILLDDGLAGTDSVEFVRRLRHSEDCRNRLTPIVMMASMPDGQRIAAARDAGVTEFLRKPFAAAHLETRLEAIRKAPRATIETDDYVGPDRRRRAAPDLGTGERRER